MSERLTIKDNLNNVLENIEKICNESNRSKEDVLLLAVSKTKSNELIMEAYNEGIRDFGENYVQELVDKINSLPKDIRWHMIGHLQRNKVKYIAGRVELIHSVDSIRLAEEISKYCIKENVPQDILLEVNMGREESKWGFLEEEVIDAVKLISSLPNITIKGLMTSAPYIEDFWKNEEIFHKMKQLSVDIQQENIDNVYMDILSMGMSNDYIAAVKCGSTIVRVGSSIFGERDYSNK